ncbi:MAG TPA: hypothetical protein VIF15_09800 [Polyangiaceae bacterium]|jgi:hypothetical protein
MRLFLARALSLTVALGVLTLLVVRAGLTGCAPRETAVPDNAAQAQAPAPPPAPPSPTAPATTAAAPTVAVPAVPTYLPASKAGPVFYPSTPPPPPPQQTVQGKP